ncbi:MAG: serine hydrolase, partial [Candidatus Promineifilaceae bacterium]|nr:serine hydrolase [Candidatus Promineifilaceae bacterium]
PEETDEPVTADIPSLLLSGGLDVAVPAVRSQLVADALPNATHVIFPGHTHDQIGGLSQCVANVFTQFIADPAAELDTSCLATPDYVGFILPDGTTTQSTDGEEEVTESGDESAGGGESTLPEDVTAQLDAYLQSQVYSDGGNPELAAPGLVLLVDTPDGRYLNAAGVSNLDDGTAMQIDDHLEIGSNTKSMTIVLLMQLVEEGLLSLDDPLSQYLPDQAALLPNGDQITIRQMAHHTAGLYDYADNIMAAGIGDPEALAAGYVPEELVQDAAENGTPYFAPGEEGQWHYSNTGYVLLGMIIEAVTGESVSDLYQTRIFDPLGMESAVLIEGVPQEGEITSHGYWWQDGEIVDTTTWNGSQGWVAGAAAMTAEDLAKYGKALAAGELFQNPDALAEMLMFDPASSRSVGTPYGLGLQDYAGDGTVWGHAGQTLGFQSLWYTKPESGIVVVGLTNSATYNADAILNVLNILEMDGPLPVSALTLLPIGDLAPTTWTWTQFTNPAEAVEIDETAGLQLVIAKDQSVSANSLECGPAFGKYSSDGAGNISFEIDPFGADCAPDSQAAKFWQYLNDAAKWHIDNGDLIIDLPADGGSLLFKIVPH